MEKDSVGQITTLPPATCAVCHDPHGSPYEGQLRAPIDSRDVTVNLCMSCHNRNTTPASNFSNSTATVTKRGSHSAQGPIVLGSGAGYIPRNFAYDTNIAYTSHASTNNPRLCAGCHVNSFTVTDAVTGAFVLESVGHLFSPDPCLDPVTGVPVIDNSCAYLPSTTRNWTGCLQAGCHASADVAASALVNERAADRQPGRPALERRRTRRSTPAASRTWMPADAGIPALPPASHAGNPTVDGVQAFNANDNIVSPAEGALFNAMMFAEDLYDHNDGSYGVHNPFYYEALLSASIAEVVRRLRRVPPGAAQPDGQGADGQGAEPQGSPVHLWTIEAERRTLSA